jgi:hypothetical protein
MTRFPLKLFVLLGLLGGLAYRLYPVAVGQPALSEAFMTEDGYLMLTVARNMAIGLGMSVSDGTISTNGVQPLATLIFTIPYVLTGGDKVTSLVGIHFLAASFALGGAFAVHAFAARVLRQQTDEPVWPWVVAMLWFLGPLLLLHTMNGLETGLYTLVLVLTLLQFARVLERGEEASLSARLALGALAGLAFLSRNDAVFLVTAMFAVWALDDLTRLKTGLAAMLARIVPPGLLSLAIAAPWLINNKLGFGSIVPISGAAQSFNASFGQNAELLPSKMFEYFFPMLPVPGSFETPPIAMWAFGAISAVIFSIFFLQTMRRGGAVVRAVVLVYTLHGVSLAIYYGLYFGAPHFMSRYLAPLAPLLIVASLSVALDLGRWLLPRWPRVLAGAYSVGGIFVSAILLGRLLLPGVSEQGHMQVVRWVEENVPDTTWIGAVQTGTLGYWHDRTINLDGKVNPDALAALQAEGHVLRYVVESDIEVIADWEGVAGWIERSDSGFSDKFELVLRDPALNLAVLRRQP